MSSVVLLAFQAGRTFVGSVARNACDHTCRRWQQRAPGHLGLATYLRGQLLRLMSTCQTARRWGIHVLEKIVSCDGYALRRCAWRLRLQRKVRLAPRKRKQRQGRGGRRRVLGSCYQGLDVHVGVPWRQWLPHAHMVRQEARHGLHVWCGGWPWLSIQNSP